MPSSAPTADIKWNPGNKPLKLLPPPAKWFFPHGRIPIRSLNRRLNLSLRPSHSHSRNRSTSNLAINHLNTNSLVISSPSISPSLSTSSPKRRKRTVWVVSLSV